ncbi:MAG: hypothetical protein C0402_16725, partial [Thermodesulfovibrio sp.]|nr:hypothetical protein [Thermodesulfovibrio sp.]
MKMVFVCFYEAYPPTSGAASVSYEIARHAGGESYLLQLGSESGENCVGNNLTVMTFAGDSNNKLSKLSALQRLIPALAEKIHSLSPDVVVLEGASWVMYHWLLLRKIRGICPNIKIVYHAHNVEYMLRKEKHGILITGLTRWAEKRILENADRSFAVSEVDRQHFERVYGITTGILPNGVEPDKFDLVSDNDINNLKAAYGLRDKTVLFMGAYAYKPNREAIDFLGWDLPAEPLAAAGKFVLVASAVFGIIVSILVFLSPLAEALGGAVGPELVFFYVLAPFIIAAVFLTNSVQNYPIGAAESEKTKALTYVPE